MRRERQRTPARRDERDAQVAEAAHRGTRSSGEPLRDTVRLPLESRFGHDFRDVRIHHDAEAGLAARDLGARAYTMGRDVVFTEGSYAPETGDGARVLAHELTHVVQQSAHTPHHGPSDAAQIIDAHDPSERDAERAGERAAETAISGDAIAAEPMATIGGASGATGGAVVQRWPWDDDTPAAGDAPPPAASDAAVSSSSGSGGSIWDSVSSVASSVAGGVASAGTAVYDNYEKSTDFRGLANELNKGVDWVEKESSDSNQKMVDSAKGIPVLEQLAQGAAWVGNATTDVTGGLVKGGGDLVSGIAGGLAHPVDAAAGMEGILEHTGTGVPFFGTTLKGLHGAYDLAVNGGGQYGNSVGDLANHLFNPLQQQEDDNKFLGGLAKGIVAPGDEKDGGGWQRWKDNPIEAATRAVTNIAPMVMGLGEAAAPEAAADVSTAAADAAADSAGGALKPPAPGGFDMEPPPSTKPYGSDFFNPQGAKTIPGMDTIPGGYDAPSPLTPETPPGEVPSPSAGPELGDGAQSGGDAADPNARKTIPPDEIPEGRMDDLLPDDVKAFKAAKEQYLAQFGDSPALPPPEPIPEAPLPSEPVQTRNPVQQLTAVNPADVYPGAPEPPGFRAGPVGSFDMSGPDFIKGLIDDSLRDAGPLNDGSQPLTSQGVGRNAPIVEAGDTAAPSSGGGPTSGGSGGAPPVAPAAAPPGLMSRVGDWFQGMFDSGGSGSGPPAAQDSDAAAADQYIKQLQAKGLAPSDAELSEPQVVKPDNAGYGNRPFLQKGQNFDPDSLYRRRRKW